MQQFTFSKYLGLTSLHLGPFVKHFFLVFFYPKIICHYMFVVSITKGQLLQLHVRVSGFAKNKSKSRMRANLLKLENLVGMSGISFEVTIGKGNSTDDVGRVYTRSIIQLFLG